MAGFWKTIRETSRYWRSVIAQAAGETFRASFGNLLKFALFLIPLMFGLVFWAVEGRSLSLSPPVFTWISALVSALIIALSVVWKLASIPARLAADAEKGYRAEVEALKESHAAASNAARASGVTLQAAATVSDHPRLLPYEAQLRLSLLKQVMEILGTEVERAIHDGAKLSGEVNRMMAGKAERDAYVHAVTAYQQATIGAATDRISRLYTENPLQQPAFPQFMMDFGFQRRLRESTHEFVQALSALPEGPTSALLSLIEPQRKAFQAGVEEIRHWAEGSKKAVSGIYKSLASS